MRYMLLICMNRDVMEALMARDLKHCVDEQRAVMEEMNQ